MTETTHWDPLQAKAMEKANKGSILLQAHQAINFLQKRTDEQLEEIYNIAQERIDHYEGKQLDIEHEWKRRNALQDEKNRKEAIAKQEELETKRATLLTELTRLDQEKAEWKTKELNLNGKRNHEDIVLDDDENTELDSNDLEEATPLPPQRPREYRGRCNWKNRQGGNCQRERCIGRRGKLVTTCKYHSDMQCKHYKNWYKNKHQTN